ncbi:MAG: thiamine biosynthesis protein ApbE [Flavobacteria bacterium RIFCSPLOWO2_12_FULL_35_11]|nr:MAG: thiamine biosynthesis protein ApbE [Flavobacteria bacterium RIFCSPLOWO2_12_FULL_35_11]
MKNCLFTLILLLFLSCEDAKTDLKIIEGNALGATFNVRYLDAGANNYESKIDSLTKVINKSASTYIPTSDLSKINQGDTTVFADANLQEVFIKSEKIYKETEGAFDPTVGILVNAWGFGPEKPIENLDSLKIQELLKFVGFDKVKLENGKIKKLYPEIYMDFNAIAPGYLVDMVSRMFEKSGVANYMVEMGGEIRARGQNEKGLPWKIGIENPNTDGSRSFATVIELKNESLATSGNYRKFKVKEDGTKYVHTINTKTGYAKESNLLSASVISKSDCADVDGYATSFMVMGFEKSKDFLKNHPELKAFLIYVDEKGAMKTYKSNNFNN